jgi:hypothetical protein
LQSSTSLPISFSSGLRLGDTLLWAGWGITPASLDSGAFSVGFWGGARAGVRAVIRRRVDLVANAEVRNGGAAVLGNGEFFVTRQLGVWLQARGAHEISTDGTATRMDWVACEAGVGWWMSSNFEIQVAYDPIWVRYQSVQDTFQHQFSLAAVIRPN